MTSSLCATLVPLPFLASPLALPSAGAQNGSRTPHRAPPVVRSCPWCEVRANKSFRGYERLEGSARFEVIHSTVYSVGALRAPHTPPSRWRLLSVCMRVATAAIAVPSTCDASRRRRRQAPTPPPPQPHPHRMTSLRIAHSSRPHPPATAPLLPVHRCLCAARCHPWATAPPLPCLRQISSPTAVRIRKSSRILLFDKQKNTRGDCRGGC